MENSVGSTFKEARHYGSGMHTTGCGGIVRYGMVIRLGLSAPEHQDSEALNGMASRGSTSPFAGGVQVQQLGAMQEPIPDLKIVHK